ncbi:MAG: alpha-2-macroglobulin [Prosthecobacter sp.]|uniref:alpha-2-macroglobulin n=1 Tax=Prosthecobacter sp. TaxID=1965333 RepID=UPI0039037B3D
MADSSDSWWARALRALFGQFHYQPPDWMRRFAKAADHQVHTHPGRYASAIVLVGVLSVVVPQVRDYYEAHRPRPRQLVQVREVHGRLSMPGLTKVVKDKAQVQPLTLSFDASLAKLDAIGKAAAGVTLSPAHEGTWKWSTDKLLVFTPTKDWPAGQEFTVKLDAAQLPKEVTLKEATWKGMTPALSIMPGESEFQIDPTDPSLQNVVVGYKSTHPLDKKQFEQSITLEVVGGSKIFDWKGQKPDMLFTVVEGKDQREFWLRTARIQVPAKEDFVKVALRKTITSTLGGRALGDDLTVKVRVPDIDSGFKITNANTEILKTEDGEPEQFLFLNTEGYATTENLLKHLGVWQEPEEFTIKDARGESVSPAVNDVTEDVLRKYAPVTLKAVELELSDDHPATTRHAFKFITEQQGRLFVRITKGVEALGGFRLGGEFRSFEATPEFPKEVQLLGKGGILALNGERKLSLQSRGVPFLRVGMARVPARQVNHLVVMTEGDFASPQFTMGDNFDESNIARFLRRVQPVAMKNEYQACYSTLDFASALQTPDSSDADASRGLFFLTAEGVEPVEDSKKRTEGDDVEDDWRVMDEATTKRFVLVTDLGLMVKKNADGSRDVFVQSIKSGEPVNGATITVLAKNGEYLLQQQSADGHALLPDVGNFQREKRPVAIIATLGNDLSFLPFERPDRLLDFSRFDIGGVLASEKEALEAFLFTERGVYRPGDEIHLGAVLKRRDWAPGLAGLPLEVDLINAKDEVIDTQKVVLAEDGFIDVKMKTDESDPTGRYIARLYLVKKDDEEKRTRLGQTVFKVEDFQPDRMKLEVKLTGDELAGWLQPRDIKADVSLQTLFGFPAAKRVLKAKMELSPGDFAFSQFPGFIFHNRLPAAEEDEESEAGQKINLGEQITDDAGEAQFDLALERFDKSCFQVSLLVEGFEADGGRSVRGGKNFLVAALPYVIGYKPDVKLDYLGKDTVANVRFIAAGPDLKALAPPDLLARIIQIKHVSVLTKQESGSYAYVSTQRESMVSEARFALPVEGANYTLPTNAAGEFRLELRDAENNVVCATPFTIVGKGDLERSMERDAELEIKLARGTWNSGESLEASLSATYTGAGLITVERERVLGWQWFKAGTTASVQHITVPNDIEGSAYVNASFVRALDSKEIFTSPLSYAVEHFVANPDKRRIEVKIDAPEKVKPGEVMKIGFQAAKPCRIVVYAVDAGIHQITDYKLPDALEHLNRKRALEVETEQLMDLILPEFSLIAQHKAFGGDADKPLRLNLNPFKRRKEPPVVFWSGLIAAGPERREVSYTVPDYFAGKLNVMAVTVAEDGVGRAETSSIVRGPLVLTPNVPFFAAPGDEFTASLTVANNLEGADANSPISIVAQVTPHLEVIESPQGAINVATGKEDTVRFRVRVKEELGSAEITFKAEAAGQVVLRRATLSVRPAAPFLTHVQSGYFRENTHEVKVTREMFPQYRKLQATGSALPLGLTRGLESYLHEYPYGCSEQITSRAMSRLLLAKEVDFGFDAADSAQQLDVAFSLLRSRQHSNGGFGYWDSDANAGVDYLSVYVTRFLTEARDAGHAVPSALLEGARKRMQQIARSTVSGLDEASIQAAAIYLLTRHGENTSTFVLNLRDHLRQKHQEAWRTHVVSAYLAGTYALLQQKKEATVLMQDYWAAVRKGKAVDGWRGWYYLDPQVSQAEGFAVVCKHFPELAGNFGYDDLAVITEPLARNRFNTISAATTILALKAYSDLAKQSGVRVSLSELSRQGGVPSILVPETTGLIKSDFSAQAGGLRFGLAQGGGRDLGAFYQVTEAGFDKGVLTQRIADGLEVFREILGADGNAVAKLKVGEGALVRLTVRNVSPDALNNIAVLDLMPGSFELEPNGLKPGRGTMPGADYVDVREDRNVFFCGLGKGEVKTFAYRIKPIAAGSYVIPPVFAESMYDRGIKGRDGGGKVSVE